MGRGGEGEMGRWGDGERGRGGDGETRRGGKILGFVLSDARLMDKEK
ncbi:MAG: hypothetical protein F6K58_01595 [Symploca sp. SIO2E9]|nr:hypothetical protein [Symploca sp. SIO2E9]